MTINYFEEVYRAFLTAERNTGSLDRFYTIGSRTLRFRFAGQALIPHISPALEHLATNIVPLQTHTICLWDSASTDTKIPPFPWRRENFFFYEKNQERKEPIDAIISFKDKGINGAYQIGISTLSMLNTDQNLSIFWVPDASRFPFSEISNPMRSVFQLWSRSNGLQLVHAGAVGTPKGGVLIAGKSGSGKSNTALSCINSGLVYAGDDYVLTSSSPVPYVYSLYNTCKLNVADVKRFPELKPEFIIPKNLHSGKAVIFIHDYSPDKIAVGFPVRAILLPKIAPNTNTRVKKVSSAEGLKALAPSTIFQLGGAEREDLHRMAKFIKKVQCYVLELGKDISSIPNPIIDLL